MKFIGTYQQFYLLVISDSHIKEFSNILVFLDSRFRVFSGKLISQCFYDWELGFNMN